MNINIKTLLLDALSTQKTTSGCRRLYFSKSCFIIRYEVSGKFLKITNIKKTSGTQRTWHQRSKRRYRIIRWYQVKVKKYLKNTNQKHAPFTLRDSNKPVMSLKFSDIQTLSIDNARLESKGIQTMKAHVQPKTRAFATETDSLTGVTLSCTDVKALNIVPNVKQVAKEIQTLKSRLPPKTRAIATETKMLTVLTKSQQTIASPRYNLKRLTARGLGSANLSKSISFKSCQTELKNETRGIQCKPDSTVGSIQTAELDVKCSCTQVSEDLLNLDCMESTASASLSNLAEKEVVIYMLNEIGELVINQNQILNNNTQMLGQLSEMNMLAKTLAQGNAWSNRNSYTKKKKTKRPYEKLIKLQTIFDIETCTPAITSKEICDKRHKSMQTEQTIPQEMSDKCTQTSFDSIKPRKLSFLRTQI